MKRNIAFLLAILMMLVQAERVCLAVSGVNTDMEARVIFETSRVDKTSNIKNIGYDSCGYTAATIGGKNALMRAPADGSNCLYFTLDDKYIYSEDGLPVTIDVEYYDTVSGHFSLCYDGASNKYWWSSATSAWSETEKVAMTGSNEWKTHSFYIDDMYAH